MIHQIKSIDKKKRLIKTDKWEYKLFKPKDLDRHIEQVREEFEREESHFNSLKQGDFIEISKDGRGHMTIIKVE